MQGGPPIVGERVQVHPVAEDLVDLLVHLVVSDLLLQGGHLPLRLLGLILLSQLQNTQRTLSELGDHVLEDLELAEESAEVDEREAQAVAGKDQVVDLDVSQAPEHRLERCQVLALDRVEQLGLHQLVFVRFLLQLRHGLVLRVQVLILFVLFGRLREFIGSARAIRLHLC